MFDIGTCELIDDIQWNSKLPSSEPCQVYCAQIQRDSGDLIIAGGTGSNELKVFEMNDQSFAPCAQISMMCRGCFSCDFSNAGDMIAMGSGEGLTRIFNVISEV